METADFEYDNLGNNSSSGSNSSIGNATGNVTACLNDYCMSNEDYLDMIEKYVFPDAFEWILIGMYMVLFTVGLVGNFLVCFAVILICLPPTVLGDVTETWYMGSVMCKIVKYLQGAAVSVSVLTLSCISVERWYAICHPLMFKSTPERAKAMIVVIWLVALCIPIPELIVLDTYIRFPGLTVLLTSCKAKWPYQNAYQIFLIISMYLLPLSLMFVKYFQIARCLWSTPLPSESSRDPLQPGGDGARTTAEQQLQSRRKVAKMLIVVVVMFGCCYLPVHLLNILRYAGALKHLPESISYFALISHQLCYVTSAMNPVIYNFMSTKFQQEFLAVCSCCCTKQRQAASCRNSNTTYRYSSSLAMNRSVVTSGAAASNRSPRTEQSLDEQPMLRPSKA